MNALSIWSQAPTARFLIPLIPLVLSVRQALHALADAIVPPQLPLFECATGLARTQVLAAAARLRLADLLAPGPLNAEELAEMTNRHPDAMQRMMRALVAAGVFRRCPDGRFANNRVSAWLRSDQPGGSRDFAEYFGSGSNVRAWSDFDRTLETGGSAFERMNGEGVWAWFESHPEERAVFARAMASMTLVDAPAVASAFPFGSLSKLCDVAGGQGVLLAEILARNPNLHGVLFDHASVLSEAAATFEARGLSERVDFAPGSIFEGVPPGCDAYLLKNVLHDWDDARSIAILKACRKVLRKGQRVLVVELLVEPESTLGVGPMSDLQMMMVCDDGRERGRADFERLFRAAGFELTRVIPTASLMSVIEGVAS
jgi:hypothetical protein